MQQELKDTLSYCPITGMFLWKISKQGCKINTPAGSLNKTTGYIRIKINQQRYQAHRLAWLYMYGHFPEGEIDHKNRVRSDNRIENLREATRQQNRFNSKQYKNNTSGQKGVTWSKATNRWIVLVRENYSGKYLGSFKIKEDAVHVAQQYIQTLHAEFYNKSIAA